MLARFKCNEIKNASLTAVDLKINNFIYDSNNKEIQSSEYVDSVKAILKEAIGNYPKWCSSFLYFNLIFDLKKFRFI